MARDVTHSYDPETDTVTRAVRFHRVPPESDRVWCPYPDCGFEGTENQVNDHRADAVAPGGDHEDEPQAGSNLRHRPTNDKED